MGFSRLRRFRRARWAACFGIGSLAALVVAASIAQLGRAADALAQASGDERFAAIVGGDFTQQNIQRQLQILGTSWWYTFGDGALEVPGRRRAELVRTKANDPPLDPASLTARARAKPGAAWIIGNEVNVPGQDKIPPPSYATLLHDYAAAIKQGDPSATIVAPNALNVSVTCEGCFSFELGQTWIDEFVRSYSEQYGGAPPIDVWGAHIYQIDWSRVPMTDYELVQGQVARFRQLVDGVSGQRGKPIWLTEFGVIWGCDRNFVGSDNKLYCPEGHFAQAQVDTYLREMGRFIRDQGPGLNLQRAFLYITFGVPETYATTFGGISLFDGPGPAANLTSPGRIWQALATGAALPTPATTPTVSGSPTPTATPTRTTTPTATRTATPTSTPRPAGVGGRGFALTSPGLGRVLLTWQGGDAQTGYNLIRLTAGGAAVVQTLPASAVRTSDALPVDEPVACYALQALSGPAALGLTDVLCVVSGFAFGAAPGKVAIQLNQGPTATLTWTPPGGQTDYILFPLGSSRVQLLPGAATGATDPTGGLPSCYIVAARTGDAISGFSDILCAIPGLSNGLG